MNNQDTPIYLDHAATTPVRPEVLQAMLPFYGERFGNPSSVHRWGREARSALEEARERIAAVLGARRSEIVFTSGGTEADNLAVLGRARWALHEQGAAVIACTAVEHKAVVSAAKRAAEEGALAVFIAVDENGRIDMMALEEVLKQRPAVLSVMWVNNEVGTIQPVPEIVQRVLEYDVVLHTDAVQALGRLPVRVRDGISLLSISGHKLGAPKGIGALYVREGVQLIGLQHGGSQERGVRPGTENIAAAIGFAVAVELAAKEQEREAARLGALRAQLERAFVDAALSINGGGAPHILNVSIPDVDRDALLVSLDLEGIAVSTASACQSGASEPSHVLVAMGRSAEREAALRLSLGRTTSQEEVTRASELILGIIERVRAVAA